MAATALFRESELGHLGPRRWALRKRLKLGLPLASGAAAAALSGRRGRVVVNHVARGNSTPGADGSWILECEEHNYGWFTHILCTSMNLYMYIEYTYSIYTSYVYVFNIHIWLISGHDSTIYMIITSSHWIKRPYPSYSTMTYQSLGPSYLMIIHDHCPLLIHCHPSSCKLVQSYHLLQYLISIHSHPSIVYYGHQG